MPELAVHVELLPLDCKSLQAETLFSACFGTLPALSIPRLHDWQQPSGITGGVHVEKNCIQIQFRWERSHAPQHGVTSSVLLPSSGILSIMRELVNLSSRSGLAAHLLVPAESLTSYVCFGIRVSFGIQFRNSCHRFVCALVVECMKWDAGIHKMFKTSLKLIRLYWSACSFEIQVSKRSAIPHQFS
jgi:hypothetical protein